MASVAQIIATIGPASKNKKAIKEMIKHKMDAARLNFSHGTYKEHAYYIKTIRAAAKELKRNYVGYEISKSYERVMNLKLQSLF